MTKKNKLGCGTDGFKIGAGKMESLLFRRKTRTTKIKEPASKYRSKPVALDFPVIRNGYESQIVFF